MRWKGIVSEKENQGGNCDFFFWAKPPDIQLQTCRKKPVKLILQKIKLYL
jgi:hypothetical protein